MAAPVIRMKPPRKSIHDGALAPGEFGWSGVDLPSHPRGGAPVLEGHPDTFACCPGATDRICIACGFLFCPACAPVAGTRGGTAGPCPRCQRDGVYVDGEHPREVRGHPDHRGF